MPMINNVSAESLSWHHAYRATRHGYQFNSILSTGVGYFILTRR